MEQHHNDLEDCASWEEEGQRIEAVLMHLPTTTPIFTLAIFPIGMEPDTEPLQKICFSLSGASKLRDLLNSTPVDSYLN